MKKFYIIAGIVLIVATLLTLFVSGRYPHDAGVEGFPLIRF